MASLPLDPIWEQSRENTTESQRGWEQQGQVSYSPGFFLPGSPETGCPLHPKPQFSVGFHLYGYDRPIHFLGSAHCSPHVVTSLSG